MQRSSRSLLPLFLSFFCLIALSACSHAEVERNEIVLVSPDGTAHAFMVEIADTSEERAKGLMLREELAPDTGMFFVFDGQAPRHFWMKDTLIPLDILYFDTDGVVVSHYTMEPCTEDPCPTYPSREPAHFALELPAGTTATYGLDIGWKLQE